MDFGAKSELQIHKYYFIGLAITLLFPQEAHFRPQNSPNEYIALITISPFLRHRNYFWVCKPKFIVNFAQMQGENLIMISNGK